MLIICTNALVKKPIMNWLRKYKLVSSAFTRIEVEVPVH